MSFQQSPGSRGRRPPFTSGREPPVIQLVEKYLAENSNLSYVNVDDMIDTIQRKVFRFARMKRSVFAQMVRTAYRQFCQMNNGSIDENQDPVVAEGVDESILDENDGDSDVEIQDEYQPKNDVANAQLNNLYASSSGRVSLTSTSNTMRPDQLPPTADSSSTSSLPSVISGNLTSSTPKNVEKEKTSGKADESEEMLDTQDSDNDLEIIDEVKGDGVIRMTSDSSQNISDSNLLAKINPDCVTVTRTTVPGDTAANQRCFVVSSSGLAGVVNAIQSGSLVRDASRKSSIVDRPDMKVPVNSARNNVSIPLLLTENGLKKLATQKKQSESPADSSDQGSKRGVKRKTTPSDNASGINDDYTPKKSKKEVAIVQDTGCRLCDFAGSEKKVEEVCQLLMHLKHPEIYETLGVTAPRGFILHGPPGTGKTLLANAIAGELQLPMLKVTGTEFISGISGESENNIRDLFAQAIAIAPCIIFIDEIDSITPKRENAQREMERRVVAQLLSCVDDLMNHQKGSQVLLIGATNRIETIDTALRRAGRFDREICLGIPDEKSRKKILEVICRNSKLAPGFDLSLLAKLTPGYVGADLLALTREAAVQAVNKALANSLERKIINDNYKNQDNGNCSDKVVKEELQNDEVMILPSPANAASHKKLENSEKKPTQHIDTDKSTEAIPNDASKVASNEGTESEMLVSSQTLVYEGTAIVENGEKKSVTDVTTEKVEADCEDDKMEVDSTEMESATSTAPIVVSPAVPSTSISAESETVVSTELKSMPIDSGVTKSTQSKESNVSNGEEPLYLKWVKDTAPLPRNELDELYIFMDDFEVALKNVQPSSKREGFATIPDTTWDDIGALKTIREELEIQILGPVKHSEAFEKLGLTKPTGVLLCGPPGCGKTLLAKAVANEAGINFISVKGPELLNMYVGESERAVRQCFLRAKNSSPCVIFFDELDSLCPRRSDTAESGSGGRVVNQLLTEMDGMEGRAGVFIMAATNRPDIIDPAVLRPGRLDKILYVGLPAASDRFEILMTLTKKGTKPVLTSDVDLKDIATRDSCNNYTGADLDSLVKEASVAAFKEWLLLNKGKDEELNYENLKVSMRHFETAFLKTKPSVSEKDRVTYAKMERTFSTITSA